MEADRGFHVWRQVIERRAAAWVESQPRDPAGRDPGMLLRGRELVTASERLEERGEDLGKQERCYIMASTALDQLEREKEQQRVEEQRREERRRRIGLGMISVLAVLVVGVATFAWYRDREADRDRRIQERATFSRQLADTAVRETGATPTWHCYSGSKPIASRTPGSPRTRWSPLWPPIPTSMR